MSQLSQDRLDALKAFTEEGFDYPSFSIDYTLGKARDLFGHMTREELSDSSSMRLAGRVRAIRRMSKKTMFWDVRDGDGHIQVFLMEKELGAQWDVLQHTQVGDIVGVSGPLMRTQTDEFSQRAQHVHLLSKNLDALPDPHVGLLDTETKYRQRYIDTLVNDDSRVRFMHRSSLVRALRRCLDEHGYMEVETPMLQALPGGATAKPFTTHHQAMDATLYLRIAPELYLKRCVVGGFDRVFEIGRNFRNEGVSTRHNPEFTMLELYEAYSDFHGMMGRCEELVQAAWHATGTQELHGELGDLIDVESNFARRRMDDLVAEHLGVERGDLSLALLTQHLGAPQESYGHALLSAFETWIEHTLVQPTFVTHYPVEVSPLAKTCPTEKSMTERFELFIDGKEMANGFSELNDPVDQEKRFAVQAAKKAQGDEESMFMDDDYIQALRVGLPPCGGLGVGIDRLTMLVTNTYTIKDVILFPSMKPKAGPV